MHGYADTLVALFREIKATASKPLVVCWIEAPQAARLQLMADGICVIGATERAIDAAAGLVAWGRARREHREAARLPRPVPRAGFALKDSPSHWVSSLTAMALLRDAGLATVETQLARTADEAVTRAADIGFPVALKIEAAAIPLIEMELRAVGIEFDEVDPEEVYSKYEATPPEWMWIEH